MYRLRASLLAAVSIPLAVLSLNPTAQAQPGAGAGQAPPGQPGAGLGGPDGRRGPVDTLGEGPWDFETETGNVHVSVVAKGIDHPWSVVFLPDGDMLLTERPGRLRIVRDGVLDPRDIAGLPDIISVSIGGLQGLALHPDFEDNRLLYFAYTKPNPEDEALTSLAVARAHWDGGYALADVEDIFVAKDWYSSAMAADNGRCCGQGPASGSYGARIAFDDDNRIYITSGDRNWGENAQDPQSHLGKIIRLNDDGSIPDDNPFVGRDGYLPELYTIGHRNPTGLRFDDSGRLWSTEFGPRGGDELNLIEAGKNYGWILITQGEHYNGDERVLGMSDVEGYVDPVFAWGVSGNPGNLIVYSGDLFPEWQGDFLVATMSRPGALERITLDDDGNVANRERMLTDLAQRMRDVAQGPDGRIYVLTDETVGAMLVVEPGE
jgi:glucose/arabinose dehydrogenase